MNPTVKILETLKKKDSVCTECRNTNCGIRYEIMAIEDKYKVYVLVGKCEENKEAY